MVIRINGNMLTHANKGITGIVYNHLNLPTQVTIAGQNILYIYDAVGTKLRKTVSGITTDYAGNYVYENSVLQFFNTAEGYVEPKGLGWEYVYQYRDHLGNVRLSYSDADGNGSINASTEILSEKNYYPFGLEHKGYNNVISSNANSTAEKFKYNGVEYEESLGMNLYEMDFRNYDPAIARFTAIDPVTNLSQSTYTAFDNNPIFWIDPSGADSTDPIVEKNTIIFSTVDEHNVTHITQVTTTATTTENEDGSVTVATSSQSVSNTIDANGKVTKGASVNVSSGSLTKDSNGNISRTKPSTSSRQITNEDNTSALGEFTNVISDYNKNNKGVYNKDKINTLADRTTDAAKAGLAVLGVFGGLDKLVGQLDPKTKELINLVGGVTSASGTAEGAGNSLKNAIGENNNFLIIHGVEQVRNGVVVKEMKTPSKPDGARKRVGPQSFQDVWEGIKSFFTKE